MGRDREVILEGGKRPGEERPGDGVNNVDVGNASARASDIGAARRWWCSTSDIDAARWRWSSTLKSSEPRHRKVGNGMEDGGIREGPAATGGEKPLKDGCPWTTQHETRLADPRHGKSRGR